MQGLWGLWDKARSFLSSGQFWPQEPEAETAIPDSRKVVRVKESGKAARQM